MRSVTVARHDSGFAILLDGKPALTPKKNPLVLPARALADAVADEWRAQPAKADPKRMPLTRLVNTAIDLPDRAGTIDELVEFGTTDLLLYRAEDPVLAERQSSAWDPCVAWARERFDVALAASTGVAPIEQPRHALERLRSVVESVDGFALVALSSAATITTSVILALALAEERLTAREAFALSQLDERYQAERWGLDHAAELRAGALADELQLVADFLHLSRS